MDCIFRSTQKSALITLHSFLQGEACAQHLTCHHEGRGKAVGKDVGGATAAAAQPVVVVACLPVEVRACSEADLANHEDHMRAALEGEAAGDGRCKATIAAAGSRNAEAAHTKTGNVACSACGDDTTQRMPMMPGQFWTTLQVMRWVCSQKEWNGVQEVKLQRALGSLIMTCAPVSAGQGHLPGLDARVDGQEGGVGGPRAVGGVAGRARAAVGRAQLADGAACPERDVGEGVQAWGRQEVSCPQRRGPTARSRAKCSHERATCPKRQSRYGSHIHCVLIIYSQRCCPHHS